MAPILARRFSPTRLWRGLRGELDQCQPSVDYDKTLDEVHEVVEYYPGLYRDVQTYLRERIKEVLTGASESIVVRIYGPDLPTLQKQAKDIEQRSATFPALKTPMPRCRPTCRISRSNPILRKLERWG